MKTSIIILEWNTLKLLKQCVKSVKKYTKDYELILIDNASTENGTKNYILKVAEKYIFNEINLGFAKGCNQGAAIASGEYLCFLNSDVTVGKNWLSAMIQTFEQNKTCGAVGALGNPKSTVLNGQIIFFNQFRHQYKVDTQVQNIMGFCMLIKREIFNQIKFQEIFEFGMYEDNVLSQNLINKGYTIWISAKAKVYHLNPGSSFSANNLNYLEILEKNRRIYYAQRKNN
jgi:GT2 family glycosyltransferase